MSRRFGDLAGSGGDSGSEAGVLAEVDVDTQVAKEVERMQKARKDIQETAVANQKKLHAKNKISYDKRRRVAETAVVVGDTVWKTDNQVSRKTAKGKMKAQFKGPYRVVKTGCNTAHIRDVKNGVLLKGVSYKMLKLQSASANK